MRRRSRRLIYKKEVCHRSGLSYPTIWKLMRAGEFPRSRVVTKGGKVAWFDDEFDDWLDRLPVRKLKGDR